MSKFKNGLWYKCNHTFGFFSKNHWYYCVGNGNLKANDNKPHKVYGFHERFFNEGEEIKIAICR